MWKKVISRAVQHQQHHQPWRFIANPFSTNSNVSAAVNSMLLRSLKEHYLEVSKMSPPPKVSPPSPFTIVKGAFDGNGPVLRRSYGDEEINISVMRLANIIPGDDGDGDDDEDEGLNQLFLNVDISKPGQSDSLHFLCGLYPDALGIHSVSMRPKVDSGSSLLIPSTYDGPTFEAIDERMRDAFHSYIEERGVNDDLFPFLQAWLYVKDHKNLMRWFKSVGTVISENRSDKQALSGDAA